MEKRTSKKKSFESIYISYNCATAGSAENKCVPRETFTQVYIRH